jgi:hypothetical protein
MTSSITQVEQSTNASNPRSCMAPKKSDKGEYEQVRMPKSLTRRARVIASALDISLPEYIEARLVPIIAGELPGILKELGMSEAAAEADVGSQAVPKSAPKKGQPKERS